MSHELDPLITQVVRCAYTVQTALYPGYQEVVYKKALLIELITQGINARAETPLSIHYRGQLIGDYYADILVEDQLIIELKALTTILPQHLAQLANYLQAAGLEIGLLLNFGQKPLQIKRVLRGHVKPALSETRRLLS